MTNTDTNQMLIGYLQANLNCLQELKDTDDKNAWDDSDYSDFYDALNSIALEVVEEVGRLRSILLTYGGPNIWLEWDGFNSCNAEFVGYWGGDKATLNCSTDLAEWLYVRLFEID